MSLLPERQLQLSPQLAATLGLEEALLYQLLADIAPFSRQHAQDSTTSWCCIPCAQLQDSLPFWSSQDIRRISHSLRDKGVLTIGSLPFGIDAEFQFNLSTVNTAPAHRSAHAVSSPRPAITAYPALDPAVPPPSRRITADWAPAGDVIAQLNQYGIPALFIEQQIVEFVTYWSERHEPRHSWNAKFLKQVVRLWRQEEVRHAQRSRETHMASDWQPSPDAVRILVEQAAINPNFVEDAIPEFILYWRDRGERRSTWNSDFVRHVKRQWARFTASLEHDSEPRPLDSQWQPSNDLYEVLSLANIPRDFATRELPAFVLFWRENGHAANSWNTKFLQHIKRQWARQASEGSQHHERRQATGTAVSTRNRSLVDDLTDRSWAG